MLTESDFTTLFGFAHITLLIIATVAIVIFIALGKLEFLQKRQIDVYIVLIVVLTFVHIYSIVLEIGRGTFLQRSLPLNICGFLYIPALLYAVVLLLDLKDKYAKLITPVLFFGSIFGGISALLFTQTDGYSFYSPYVLQTTIFHCVLVMIAIYLVIYEGIEFTIRDILISCITLAILLPFAYLADLYFGANYMFLMDPVSGVDSPLDLLGCGELRIFELIMMTIALHFLVYFIYKLCLRFTVNSKRNQ